MSNTQQGPDWWLASDGRWYPPKGTPPPPAAPARPSIFLWVAGALCGLLGLWLTIIAFADNSPTAESNVGGRFVFGVIFLAVAAVSFYVNINRLQR